jgi:hypothetical protein
MIDMNLKIVKLMWVSKNEPIIWDAQSNEPFIKSNQIEKVLSKYVSVNDWKEKFEFGYLRWLHEDNDVLNIHSIHSAINQMIIQVLKKVNEELKDLGVQLFYWFDVERDLDDLMDYQWRKSPISAKDLTFLEHQNFALDLDNFLILPL